MEPASNDSAAPQAPIPAPQPPGGTGQAREPLPPMSLPPPPPPPPPARQQGGASGIVADASSSVTPALPQTAGPAIIDDGDLIEKEWVTKAKQIVDSNRSDPYKQSEELTVFRADYMKKRYGKNIKLSK